MEKASLTQYVWNAVTSVTSSPATLELHNVTCTVHVLSAPRNASLCRLHIEGPAANAHLRIATVIHLVLQGLHATSTPRHSTACWQPGMVQQAICSVVCLTSMHTFNDHKPHSACTSKSKIMTTASQGPPARAVYVPVCTAESNRCSGSAGISCRREDLARKWPQQ